MMIVLISKFTKIEIKKNNKISKAGCVGPAPLDFLEGYVTGGEKSSLNWNSNPGPLVYCATELM